MPIYFDSDGSNERRFGGILADILLAYGVVAFCLFFGTLFALCCCGNYYTTREKQRAIRQQNRQYTQNVRFWIALFLRKFLAKLAFAFVGTSPFWVRCYCVQKHGGWYNEALSSTLLSSLALLLHELCFIATCYLVLHTNTICFMFSFDIKYLCISRLTWVNDVCRNSECIHS